MAIFDYTVTETTEGNFDVNLPLAKTTAVSDLLFQQVDLLLNTYLGEFVYDTLQGMPYQSILGKNFDMTSLESVYYDKISALVYFKDLTDFDVSINPSRVINVTFSVIATNGAQQEFSFIGSL